MSALATPAPVVAGEAALAAELADWQRDNGYEPQCASEQVMTGNYRTQEHHDWLQEFIIRWDEMLDAGGPTVGPEPLSSDAVYWTLDTIKSFMCDIDGEGGGETQAEFTRLFDAQFPVFVAAPALVDALRDAVIAMEEAGWDIGANSGVLNRSRAALYAATHRASDDSEPVLPFDNADDEDDEPGHQGYDGYECFCTDGRHGEVPDDTPSIDTSFHDYEMGGEA